VKLAAEIAALAPLAIRQAKEVLLRGADVPVEVGLALEARASQLLYATEDQKEGMKAFMEKRAAKFEGR
jgi:enoyl-CoA hydratase/carnithine racemase